MREALEDASGGQTISFNISGAGPHVIKPTSELPGLVDSVSIDGYTQPGASPNTAAAWQPGNASIRIVLDGSLAGPGVNGLEVAQRTQRIIRMQDGQITSDEATAPAQAAS